MSGKRKLNSEGDKLYGVHYSLEIMAADVCEINNNLSVVKEIIERILKSKEEEQKAE